MKNRYSTVLLLSLCSFSVFALEPRSLKIDSRQSVTGPCHFQVPANVADRSQCATIKVPIDYANGQNSSFISLESITIKGPGTSKTATLLLDGGPGGSGNAVLHLLTDPVFAARLLQLGDIIVLAQRGTRFTSQPLNCSGSFKRCAEALQKTPDIASFTTEASARDIVSFVNENSYQNIRILAYSYGTRLALQLARQAPDLIESMALDSVIPLETNHQDLRGIDDALIALDKACDASAGCKAHVPDSIVESFLVSMAKLQKRPILIPSALGALKLTPQVFLERVVKGLQAGDTLRYIPRFITEISKSRPGLISRDLLNGPGMGIVSGDTDLAVGLLMAINCSDINDVNDHRIKETVNNLKAQVTDSVAHAGINVLQGVLNDTVQRQGNRCKTLPYSATSSLENDEIIYNGPTLLLSGELDPIAPDGNAAHVLRHLGTNNKSVLFPGISHAVTFESQCARDLAASFFRDGIDTLTTGCVEAQNIDFPVGDGLIVAADRE